MLTLDQAIQNRIEIKRRAREQALQQQRERLTEIERREQEIAVRGRTILESHYGFSLEGIEIKAIYQPAAHDNHHYNLRLYFPGEYAPHNVATNQAFPGDKVEACLLTAQWSALHVVNSAKDCRRDTFHDLLDAIMFARFGTTDPDTAAILIEEDF